MAEGKRKKSVYRNHRRQIIIIALLGAAVVLLSFCCLFAGSASMSFGDCIHALLRKSTAANNRIIWNIRIPRVLAALAAGAGLSASGLIMQTCLNNPMASPSTLGVSNAAVFGANLSILVFSGGLLSAGNSLTNQWAVGNPYSTSLLAFLFSILSILLVLALCRIRSFTPNVVVLAGIALGAVWTAATTVLQFYATDVGLSAAVIWNFGDLGRASYKTDLIMLAVAACGILFFSLLSWKYNALLGGDAAAKSMGIHVAALRFCSLLLASAITAVCVSFLGVIGFVGIICPHITKKVLGQDHRFGIPAASLGGSLLLLFADTLSRSMGRGSALPVGAVTSLLGAPFFLAVIFSGKEGGRC